MEKARTGLLKYEELSPNIKNVFTAQQVEEVAEHGKLLGYSDEEIGDFLEMGAIPKPNKKPPKVPLTPDEESRRRWAILPASSSQEGYLFDSLEVRELQVQPEGTLEQVPACRREKLFLQGSALRSPAAKDVDVAIFVADDVFAKYRTRSAARGS